MKKRLKDFVDFSLLPFDLRKRLEVLPYDGELALIEMYDENSDFLKYAHAANVAKDFLVTDDKDLYHYTTFESLKSIISGKKFWIKKKSYMNDPEEFSYTYLLSRDLLKKIGANDNEIKFFDHLIKQAEFDIYLWSFSENRTSQALWGNYGNKDGIAIKINTKELMSTLAIHFSKGEKCIDEYGEGNAYSFPLKVLYERDEQEKRLVVILTQWLRAHRSFSFDESDMKEIIEECLKSLFLYATFLKNPLLYQEEEVRFVIVNINYQGKSVPEFWHDSVPFVSCPITDNLIAEIIIQRGSKVKQADIELFFAKNGLDTIEVSNSILPY